MIEPQYVLNLLSITTQVTATILGFLIVFWIFWYENIGKKIDFVYGTRYIGKKYYVCFKKFENDFLNNFLRSNITLTHITYSQIFSKTKLLVLYLKIKNWLKWKWVYRLKYKKYNYETIFTAFLFFSVLMIGAIFVILFNVSYIVTFTKFTTEQLCEDQSLYLLVETVHQNFNLFMISFIFTLYLSFIQSIQLLKRKSEPAFNDNSDVT